ncbi:MAG: MBL fold metallo-hydrolase [Bacilli bacterium]|nr:MBL fold metallo-hydrolase [Bacilli bacterium]
MPKNGTRTILVIEAKENYYIGKCDFSKIYIYEEDNKKEIGDIFVADVTCSPLSFTSYESQFNFENYLNKKGVYYQAFIDNEKYILKSITRYKSLQTFLMRNINDENKFFCKTVLFGNYKDNELLEYAEISGIAYLITSTGFHLSFLKKGITKCLSMFMDEDRAKKRARYIVILLCIPTLNTFGTFRVFLSTIIDLFPKIDDKLFSVMSTIIMINPNLGIDNGFITSFFVIIFHKLSFRIINIKNKVNKFAVSFCFSFFINIIVSAAINSTFNLLASFYMLILSFGVSISYCAILLAMLFGNNKLINICRSILLRRFRISSKFGISFYIFHKEIFIITIVVILFLFLCLIGFKLHKQAKILLVSSLIPLFIFSSSKINIPNKFISFINVGQGDSILIKNENESILIDTGGNKSVDIANDTLIPYFKKMKIKKLDYVFITHNDYDHNGALNKLINNFTVDKVITNRFSTYYTGNLLFYNLNNINASSTNDQSIVLYFRYINKYFLLMGDAGFEVENKIMETNKVTCDVIKIGHHGSKYSTQETFINYCSPKYAIISVGRKNGYGHPDDNVVNMLKSKNIKILRTDMNGTIMFK